jgi:DNA-binding transcriptional regulator PaaX
VSEYKYYFKKTRSEIVKDIFKGLLITGIICIAATSPYFIVNFCRNYRRFKKYKKKEIYNTFYRLEKDGCIIIKERNHQIYISLTQKGKRRASWFQIDSLDIKKPKKWDKKWRIVIFDIAQLKKHFREAFRGKLKELGFIPLQKSVWVHPFECKNEINLLKDFFGLNNKEIRLITAENIEEDAWLKKLFKII